MDIRVTTALFLMGLSVAIVLFYLLMREKRAHARLGEQLDETEQHITDLGYLLDYDTLTQCHSRRYFERKVRQALGRGGHPQTVLMIADIDYFKSINDTYGHTAGDEYLAAVGKLIFQQIGKDGLVARLGGDEFWIALPGVSSDVAEQIADRVRQTIDKLSLSVASAKISRSASIGITVVPRGTDLVDAMREADSALYLAKAMGRNQTRLTDASTRRHLDEVRTKPTVERIREGLNADEFTYFLQPIFDFGTLRPRGFEALIRWVRKDGTVLLPADFMDSITNHYNLNLRPPIAIANEAAAMFNGTPSDVFFSFNISTTFLRKIAANDNTWMEDLLDRLVPNNLVFEIVETAVIEDIRFTSTMLTDLRKEGVRIALDDFGTGYSNLMRLRDLPVDIVKIDRSFVAKIAESPKDASILKALKSMSDDLGFEIIAEGIETQQQFNILRDFGIDMAQGFLLGEPAPWQDWSTKLRTQHWGTADLGTADLGTAQSDGLKTDPMTPDMTGSANVTGPNLGARQLRSRTA